MKKIIPTLFATVLAISSISLLIGCSDAVPDDPTAEDRGDANKVEGEGDPDNLTNETTDPDNNDKE